MGLPNKTIAGDAFFSGLTELQYISKALSVTVQMPLQNVTRPQR